MGATVVGGQVDRAEVGDDGGGENVVNRDEVRREEGLPLGQRSEFGAVHPKNKAQAGA